MKNKYSAAYETFKIILKGHLITFAHVMLDTEKMKYVSDPLSPIIVYHPK